MCLVRPPYPFDENKCPTPIPTAVTFTLPKATETIIVLSQSDQRFYRPVTGSSLWFFDFKLFRKGSKEELTSSENMRPGSRSTKLHIYLEEGDYVVHVRLDRSTDRQKVRRVHYGVALVC